MGHKLMTLEEKWDLLDAIKAAEDADDEAEAERLMRTLPLAPALARIAKENYGKEFLIEHGYNLSEANVEYGDGWLDR
jgi:hypothetical protein